MALGNSKPINRGKEDQQMTQDGSHFFNACIFVQAGFENDSGDLTDDYREYISSLRRHYPELAHWGDSAIGLAFGEYSQDVWLVSWAYWSIETRDEAFLNYCCWRQTRGFWTDDLELEKLSQANEWKNYDIVCNSVMPNERGVDS